ncbi:MAG: type II toxin-antitoxin system HicA family toxin [Taibaiella sp.]|nr:type II toxin-antitoxin system HicA family toxin [Taibaiella sp.]
MNLSPSYLIKLLVQNGFIYKRTGGSHQVYYNSSTHKTEIVPVHGNKDLKKGTFLAIMKQAGIDNLHP